MEILLIAFTMVLFSLLLLLFNIEQHRKTKNTALAKIDEAWAMELGRPGAEAIIRARRNVKNMTFADTLGASGKEPKT